MRGNARVVSVVDGDTVKVRYGSGRIRTTRILGLDTPETKKPGTPIECGGPQATTAMKKLLLQGRRGRVVKLWSDPTQDLSDRYGRDLRVLEVAGKDVAEKMIATGWAIHYVYAGVPVLRAGPYQAAQDAAVGAGRGIWSHCAGEVHRPRSAIATVAMDSRSATAAAARACKSLTTKRYAPPHKTTFYIGGTASCRVARRHVLRLVSTHDRTPRIRGWRCQVGDEPPHGNGECRRNGRSFYWGVVD